MNYEVQMIPTDAIEPAPWNPNEEDVGTFNQLVETMEEDGVLENVVVVPLEDGRYRIVSGEHRWKAARLNDLDEIPAVVRDDWDEDAQKIRTVRMNVLRGNLNPDKFVDLYQELAKKYDPMALRKMLGFEYKEKELDRLLKNVRKSLPPKLKKDLDERKDKIRNVEDLSAVVQSLYSQYGGTVDQSFMFLTFGGQVHLMVKLNKKTKDRLQKVLADYDNANDLIGKVLDQVVSG